LEKRCGFLVLAVAAAVLSVHAQSAEARTIVLRPAADVTVLSDGGVQRGRSFLAVGGKDSAKAYLRWHVPSGAAVKRARIELYTPTGGRGLRIHAGRTTSSERSLPTRGARAFRLAGALPGAASRSWLKLDVTRFVGGDSLTIIVSKRSGTETRLTSREGAAEFRPRLVLVLNRVPRCQNGERLGAEDDVLSGRLSCGDDGALRYRLKGSPAHGTVEVSPRGDFAYMPAPNFHGADAFVFEACEVAHPGGALPRALRSWSGRSTTRPRHAPSR
jgi:hypothetical protein